jgi:hypothetical protein
MNTVTRSTYQPSPLDRLSWYKAKAAYVPELSQVINNPFTKIFNKEKKQ